MTEPRSDRVLYGVWLSPYVSLVAQVLTEAGLPFRYERVSPFLGETAGEAHLARNPLGKIPALREPNGPVLSESQAICRYLARTHAAVRPFYPCDDPERCAEVDRLGDFLTFSVSGPFFQWFVVGAYWPKVFGTRTEAESATFGRWSMLMIRLSLERLERDATWAPFLLGDAPTLPDFHLFHVLELGRTFAEFFEMPELDLADGDARLRGFYQAMAARPATAQILAAQAAERDRTRREIFEDFGRVTAPDLDAARPLLAAVFGHEV